MRYWSNRVYRETVEHRTLSADLEYPATDEDLDFADDKVFPIVQCGTNIRGESGLVASVLPRFQSLRLAAQQGVFLMNCNLNLPFQDSLLRMLSRAEEPGLKKFIFRRAMREELLRWLQFRNVHPAMLFPDLDGFARFVGLKRSLFPSDSLADPHR